MRNGIKKSGLVPLFMVVSGVSLANEPSRLVHNPFSRPPSTAVTYDDRRPAEEEGGVPELDLRATMVSSSDKLANVAGRTMRTGDEMQGYTLLRIFEDRAVFLRRGKRLTVYVKPHLVDDYLVEEDE